MRSDVLLLYPWLELCCYYSLKNSIICPYMWKILYHSRDIFRMPFHSAMSYRKLASLCTLNVVNN